MPGLFLLYNLVFTGRQRCPWSFLFLVCWSYQDQAFSPKPSLVSLGNVKAFWFYDAHCTSRHMSVFELSLTLLLLLWHSGVVQLLSRVRLFVTSWSGACQASLSSTISRSLLKPMSIESVMLSNLLILCCRLLLLPSTFSSIKSFPVSQHFTSGGQGIGASASASVLPVNIQGRFPLGLTGLISLLSKGQSSLASQFKSINIAYFR